MGSPISSIDCKSGPVGVAVNQQDEVFITQWDGHCITVFGSNGEYLRSFGSYGHLRGRFWYPHGIAVDNVGNIFIADLNHNRVQKFSSQGDFLAEANTGSSPRGISFNAYNCLVYVSCDAGYIKVFYHDLSYLGTLSMDGTYLGQLDTPRHIACDKAGNVYVADSGNCRVQVFTPEGKFLKKLGGIGKGELHLPMGIAIARLP